MAKKIDLGVSTGPNAAERSVIRSGNKKVESIAAPDTTSDPTSPQESERLSRADKTRRVQNEIDKTHSLPRGRNNPIHSTVPGLNSTNTHHEAMARHSADFIDAASKGNRGKMEASRTAFHAVRQSSRGVPTNIETPCTGSGCKKTVSKGTSCGSAGCGAGPNVQRPLG